MRGRMRLRHWLAGAVLPLVFCGALWLVLPLGSEADSPQARASSLQQKIDTLRRFADSVIAKVR